MKNLISNKGQAAVEFSLLAPLLFLIFFCVIQLAYCAYASFALQRATLAIARDAASSDSPSSYNPYFQLVYCLAPLGKLNRQALATVLATKCDINTDGNVVHVQLIYPMPIWIPGVGKIFGQKLSLNSVQTSPMTSSLQMAFQILGKPLPNLSFTGLNLPYVHLSSFSTSTVDENSI